MAPVARLGVIGGIIRVSTKAQAGTDSPENQRETLARAGATVFYEEAVSGSAKGGQRRRESPSWQRLVADITGGRRGSCHWGRLRDHNSGIASPWQWRR